MKGNSELEDLIAHFAQPSVLRVIVDRLERPLARMASQIDGQGGRDQVADVLAVVDDTMKGLMKKLWP